jgi:long-chain acyl-CoA synthetase
MGPDCVNLVAMPMFHIGGCGYGTSAMMVGGHTVLMREVNTAKIIELIAQCRVTHTFLVPTVVQSLLDVLGVKQADLSSFKWLMYGAAPMGDVLLRRAMDMLRCEFIQAYGMTETSGSVVLLPPADHESDSPNKHRLRSCGVPGPGVEIRIHDNDNNRDCETGEVGEIWIRTAQNMLGYWKRPDETAKAIDADGWFKSGDAGYVDADGYVYIHDRVKDMIVSGGENVYPAEVENVILGHPGVADVAVIGVPSDKWGETGLAVIVKKDAAETEADIIAHCDGKLARFKMPGGIRFIEVIPRNASGKALKRDLRIQFPTL